MSKGEYNDDFNGSMARPSDKEDDSMIPDFPEATNLSPETPIPGAERVGDWMEALAEELNRRASLADAHGHDEAAIILWEIVGSIEKVTEDFLANSEIGWMRVKREELEMLRAFAERHGWLTADGAYVAGQDRVFYCTCTQTPTTPKEMRQPFTPWPQERVQNEVLVTERGVWFSTPALAEAHARKEWE